MAAPASCDVVPSPFALVVGAGPARASRPATLVTQKQSSGSYRGLPTELLQQIFSEVHRLYQSGHAYRMPPLSYLTISKRLYALVRPIWLSAMRLSGSAHIVDSHIAAPVYEVKSSLRKLWINTEEPLLMSQAAAISMLSKLECLTLGAEERLEDRLAGLVGHYSGLQAATTHNFSHITEGIHLFPHLRVLVVLPPCAVFRLRGDVKNLDYFEADWSSMPAQLQSWRIWPRHLAIKFSRPAMDHGQINTLCLDQTEEITLIVNGIAASGTCSGGISARAGSTPFVATSSWMVRVPQRP
ncbi:hypothetical protein JCM3774_001201 [Rhodotorula dairenensis]